jgi:hypothetical protein
LQAEIDEILRGTKYERPIPSQRQPELYPGWERFDWTDA